MSRPNRYTPAAPPPEDLLQRILEGIAKFVFWAGVIVAGGALALLVFYTATFAGDSSSANTQRALANIDTCRAVLLPGAFAAAIGAAYLFWGEEVLSALLLISAAILYFSPMYLPQMISLSGSSPVPGAAIKAIQQGGAILGIVAIGVALIDALIRILDRSKQGAKADQMKYGRGVRAERDIQNVFLGKCWQLPFCRKFVRDKCPIYHAKRTCWKERVGCMCEEQVIGAAMAGKAIPKDELAAAAYIPRNNALSIEAKKERCRTCVIYNEHQKQKYKLTLPLVIAGLIGIYVVGRVGMKEAVGVFIVSADRIVGAATLRGSGSSIAQADPASLNLFKEVLLVCAFLVIFAYMMRLIEYVYFKAKV